MGWGTAGRGRLKRKEIVVYLWLIHIAWQKPTHFKAIIFQLKINKFKKTDWDSLRAMTLSHGFGYLLLLLHQVYTLSV